MIIMKQSHALFVFLFALSLVGVLVAGFLFLQDGRRSVVREKFAVAANQKTKEGQHNLALVHALDGEFVKARKWLIKSAKQGDLSSLFILPDYYSRDTIEGWECGPDSVEAYAWLGVLAVRIDDPTVCSQQWTDDDRRRMRGDMLKRQLKLGLNGDLLMRAQTLEAEYIRDYGFKI